MKLRQRLLAFALALSCLGAFAQTATPPRVGFMWVGATDASQTAAFREEMRSLGYVDGRTIAFDAPVEAADYESSPASGCWLLSGTKLKSMPCVCAIKESPSRGRAPIPVPGCAEPEQPWY